MDLSSVRDNLSKNKYKTPSNFCSDVRQIFQNSRTYNTNKRSRIYVMTVRLSAIFEEHIKIIIHNWKKAKKRDNRKSARTQIHFSSSDEESDISYTESETCSSTQWTHTKSQSQGSTSNSGSDEDIPLNKLSEQSKLDSKSPLICKELTVSLTPHLFDPSESSQSYKSSRKKSQPPSIISSDTDETTKSSVNIEFVNVNMDSNSSTKDTNNSLDNIKITNKSESDSRDCYEPPTKSSISESEDSDNYSLSILPKLTRKSDTEDSYKPPGRKNSQTSSSGDDSEYNFKSQRKTRTIKSNRTEEMSSRSSRKRGPRKKYTPESDDSFELDEKEDVSFSSECSDLDGSDNEPLSVQLKRIGMKNGNHSCVRSGGGSSEEPSTSAQRSQRTKKRRKSKDLSDSDTEKEVYVKRFKGNSEHGKCFTSVSSRGRVRKLTARARAMIRE